MSRLFLATLVLMLAVDGRSAAQQPPRAPVNLDFETGAPGELPAGWSLATGTKPPGVSAAVTTEEKRGGTQGVVLERAAAGSGVSLNLLQQIDAAPYRGRRVRFRLAVKTDSTTRAQMWMRIDVAPPPKPTTKAAPPPLFLDNMDDRPISGVEWSEHEVVADVPAAAGRIAFGVFLTGIGKAWVDEGAFDALGKAESVAPEAPRPLSRRGLVNVTAFTRLLGYVRHFHPSDEAAAADWDGFAVAGMRAVEASPDAATLIRQLEQLFRPIAPAVSIVPSGELSRLEPVPGVDDSRLLTWKHVGFGGKYTPSIFRSERVAATATPSPFEVELGGGVAVRVPLAVATDGRVTLPRPVTAAAAPVPHPTRQRFNPADRATRLGAVALAWNVLQHFYPYFDTVKTDWAAALRVALQEAATDRDVREFGETLRRMVAALHDGHARVFAPADAELQFAPPVTLDWVEDKLTVVHVADAATGLAPGDVIIAVEGIPAPILLDGMEQLISGATPQWRRLRAVQDVLTGPRDSAVKLRVEQLSAPGTSVEMTLTRTVSGFSAPAPLDKVAEVESGVFYVDLTRVSDVEFAAAAPKLAAARGIVFDVRGAPGALGPEALFSPLVAEPVTSPQFHVPEPSRPDREETRFSRSGEWLLPPKAPQLAARKVFLTDARAIGYAESCLAIVERYKLGAIVGGPTAGTNGNATRFEVPGDFTIIFTGLKVLRHDGSPHHGVGITPTVSVARTRAGVAAGRDEVLEQGIRIAAGG
jgi:C-terminal processing protease CtpA/Prc